MLAKGIELLNLKCLARFLYTSKQNLFSKYAVFSSPSSNVSLFRLTLRSLPEKTKKQQKHLKLLTSYF
jgi:hypothetical protein